MISTSKTVAELFIGELEPIFPNAGKRLRVWADVDKYNWKEDEDIWKQKRGIASKEYELYFDREYITSFSEESDFYQVRTQFFRSLKKLYKEGKIFVHEEVYKVKDEEEKQKQIAKEAEELAAIPKARSAEEEIVREVIVKSAKKKGKHVS